jgi:hypothetical protein
MRLVIEVVFTLCVIIPLMEYNFHVGAATLIVYLTCFNHSNKPKLKEQK